MRAIRRHVVDPIVSAFLRTPASALVGANLLLVRYRGRRTGRELELPVAYVRDGPRLLVLVGQAASKTWWRNFATPLVVELVIRGDHQPAVARLIPAGSEAAADAAAVVRSANPRVRVTADTQIIELRPTGEHLTSRKTAISAVDGWPHDDLDPRASELPPTAFRRRELAF